MWTAKFQGCRAVCQAKPACVEMFPNGNQMTQIIHLGLSSDCQPFSSSAATDLAKSFVVNSLMKNLGPYAQMALFTSQATSGAGMGGGMGFGGCGFAQGYFMQNNLNGRGMVGQSGANNVQCQQQKAFLQNQIMTYNQQLSQPTDQAQRSQIQQSINQLTTQLAYPC